MPAATGSGSSAARSRRLALAAGALLLLLIGLRLAWLSDDAYITLRSVENWVRGNGLRWNIDDRVQTYTHPLWMLVLAGGRMLTGEVYFATIAVSLCISTAAVVWLLARAGNAAGIAATAALLAAARAFGDYMTSGLETPLSFLLLAAFVTACGSAGAPARRAALAVLLAALAATNRLDLALLCAPAALAAQRGVPWRARLRLTAVAGLPLAVWIAFAWLYYGSPLPVTAHAKAFGIGVPPADLAAQGVRYLWHTALHDPVLFFAVALGVPALCAAAPTRWLGAGALAYLAYVVRVGGDFMQGRFLLPPFTVVVAALAPRLSPAGIRSAAVVGVAALVLGCLPGLPPWLAPPAADTPPSQADIDARHGIADERRVYYRDLGLWSPARDAPRFGALESLVFPEGRSRRWWLLNGAVGAAGFSAGSNGHIVDPLLCEPLIARLPARDPSRWRIGHVLRRIPEGYWETLRDGENRLHHPGLAAYWERLRTLTRAPLFEGRRLAALAGAVLGGGDAGLRAFVAEHYYAPPRLPVDIAALPPPLPPGIYWFDEPRLRIVYDGGVAVRWPAPQRASRVDLEVLGLCAFRCRFARAGEVVAEVLQPPTFAGTDLRGVAGLRRERLLLGGSIAFDELWLDPVDIPGSEFATGPPALGAIAIED